MAHVHVRMTGQEQNTVGAFDFEKIVNHEAVAFRKKFLAYRQCQKKVTALDNLAQAQSFNKTEYLALLRRCLNKGMLDVEEERFLDHLIAKTGEEYGIWSYRTPWVKRQIKHRGDLLDASRADLVMTTINRPKRQTVTQLEFPLEMMVPPQPSYERVAL